MCGVASTLLQSRRHLKPTLLFQPKVFIALSMHKLLLALFLFSSLLTTAHAQVLKTTRYTILLDNGTVAGEQIVERTSQDTIKVHFDFKENGRGPTFDEIIKIGPDHTMLEFHVTGTSEMGGAVDERFTRKGGLAEWVAKSERGNKVLKGPAFYLPIDSSWEVNSLMINALASSRTSSLPPHP